MSEKEKQQKNIYELCLKIVSIMKKKNNMKKFKLKSEEIKEIAAIKGGCIASDKITVDGNKIGYMYREEPSNEYDSGWRFFAGDETEEYTDNADNFGIYNLNTICNYDSDIIPLLESEIGKAFEKDASGIFKEVKD